MKRHRLPSLGLALLGLAVLTVTSLQAQPTIYSDSLGDISTNVVTGNGTLDILKMEVGDTATDVVFNLTVNGNISTTSWGNFMIGVANMKSAGNTNVTGNGWARPINLIADATHGMTHWIGSWVSGGGGGQVWTWGGSSWSGPVAPAGYSFGVNTNGTSTLSYTVKKSVLGVTNGDTIVFDAYSSGGGNNDSAVDALSNPNIAITSWSGPYTSSTTTGLSSYTLSNSLETVTQPISFSVNMNAQIALGTFDPGAGDQLSVEWGPNPDGDGTFAYLTDNDHDGIYTGQPNVTAPLSASVSYRYVIEPADINQPLLRETVARSFIMPDAPLVLGTVFFNNIEGFRNVTFTVDMSVQQAMGNFDPQTQDVKVVGDFTNNWSTGADNTPMTPLGNGLYAKTVQIGGATGKALQYKFYKTGQGNDGYESIGNRQATLTLNPDGQPEPAQVLPTVFFNNLEAVPATRNVTFTVDMSVQVALGNFPVTGGTVFVSGELNGWNKSSALSDQGNNIFSGTFAVTGNEGAASAYKFYSPQIGAGDNGYENISNRTFLLGPDGTPQSLPSAFWNNMSSSSTFNSWSGGQPLTTPLLLQYAIGGAAGPGADGVAPVTTHNETTIFLTAIVRINDPSLTVTGQTTANLNAGPWTSDGVTVSDAVDQTGVPEGSRRRIFSIPRQGPQKFLRLTATLTL